MSIESAAMCEIRAVIRYLVAKENSPHEIFNEVRTVYGEGHMNRISVYKWCSKFENGCMNVHDDLRSERPSILSDDIVKRVENAVCDDRRLTLDELSAMIPQQSKSLLHETITKSLGFHKLYARWVPKQLTELHMFNRVQASREFFERYELDGDNFLKSIVTGDETWVAHYIPETKRQSEQRRHTTSPSTKKFKTTISAKKILASMFWDHKGIILIEYLPQGETINAASGVCLLHDNARPHTANVTKQLLDSFGLDVLNHPPYSPDLVPSDYHLFTSLKKHMGGKQFSTDEEVKGAVDKWSKEVAAEFYETGIKY
ncbi:hypothetical protein QTP88_006158 [Uroleucon formosanum]